MTETRDGSYLEYSKTSIDEAMLDALTDKYFLPWDQQHSLPGEVTK